MDRARFIEPREAIAEAFEGATALLMKHLSDRRDLSLTSAAVLSTLCAEGPVRLTALAAAIGVSQPSMTQLVQRLERDDLATRVSDPHDGRGTLVGITDAGRALVVDRRRARRGRLAALLMTLSAEDEATLAQAMHDALPVLRRLLDDATAGHISCRPAASGSLHAAPEPVCSGALSPAFSSPQEVRHHD
jgi:DNA-binding MarR family transcriptional regulator